MPLDPVPEAPVVRAVPVAPGAMPVLVVPPAAPLVPDAGVWLPESPRALGLPAPVVPELGALAPEPWAPEPWAADPLEPVVPDPLAAPDCPALPDAAPVPPLVLPLLCAYASEIAVANAATAATPFKVPRIVLSCPCCKAIPPQGVMPGRLTGLYR